MGVGYLSSLYGSLKNPPVQGQIIEASIVIALLQHYCGEDNEAFNDGRTSRSERS